MIQVAVQAIWSLREQVARGPLFTDIDRTDWRPLTGRARVAQEDVFTASTLFREHRNVDELCKNDTYLYTIDKPQIEPSTRTWFKSPLRLETWRAKLYSEPQEPWFCTSFKPVMPLDEKSFARQR